MKIHEIFGENRLEFVEKCKIKIGGITSTEQVKLSIIPAKSVGFNTKNEGNFETKKILIFLIKISIEN